VQTPELFRLERPRCASSSGVLDVLREPFGELFVRIEERRHDEVEQSPQFCLSAENSSIGTEQLTVHRVLDGSTSQQQSISAVERK